MWPFVKERRRRDDLRYFTASGKMLIRGASRRRQSARSSADCIQPAPHLLFHRPPSGSPSVFLPSRWRRLQPPAPADVVATVNGHPIDQATWNATTAASRNGPQKPSQVQSQIAHLEILRNLIDDDIKQQRAPSSTLSQPTRRYRLNSPDQGALYAGGNSTAVKRKTCRSMI